MLRLSRALFLSFVLLCGKGVSSGPEIPFYAHQRPPEGFLWYGSLVVSQKEQPPSPTQPLPSTSRPALSTPEGRNQALRERLESAIQKVLDAPTLENAIAAQRLQKVVFERSDAVSKAWMLSTLLDAGLLTPKDNPNPLHRKMLKDEEEQSNRAHLKALSQEWGIVVEISQDCAYCTAFLPILEELQNKTSLQILGAGNVSTKAYGPFPLQKSKNFLRQFNPEGLTPTAYLVHKDGGEIYPIARGVTDAQAIIQNIFSVLSYRGNNQRREHDVKAFFVLAYLSDLSLT